jgi:hypothetical protein
MRSPEIDLKRHHTHHVWFSMRFEYAQMAINLHSKVWVTQLERIEKF